MANDIKLESGLWKRVNELLYLRPGLIQALKKSRESLNFERRAFGLEPSLAPPQNLLPNKNLLFDVLLTQDLEIDFKRGEIGSSFQFLSLADLDFRNHNNSKIRPAKNVNLNI